MESPPQSGFPAPRMDSPRKKGLSAPPVCSTPQGGLPAPRMDSPPPSYRNLMAPRMDSPPPSYRGLPPPPKDSTCEKDLPAPKKDSTCEKSLPAPKNDSTCEKGIQASSKDSDSQESRPVSTMDLLYQTDLPTVSINIPLERCVLPSMADIAPHTIYKKSMANNRFTIYISTRDLYTIGDRVDRIYGVVYIDPDFLDDRKVFGKVILTFRYGREDEEVMGLKFTNEIVVFFSQLYPRLEKDLLEPLTSMQETLMRRLGPNAHPFFMSLPPHIPPSVRLIPFKPYNSAAPGNSYDIRVFLAEDPEEKIPKRNILRMAIRVLQKGIRKTLPNPNNIYYEDDIEADMAESGPPQATADKSYLFNGGKIELEAILDKQFYCHEEPIEVTVIIRNNSKKDVRKVKVRLIQEVDVCMFAYGKFKNVVAHVTERMEPPLTFNNTFNQTFQLNPAKTPPTDWIALEDSLNKGPDMLASTITTPSDHPDNCTIFVNYYAKVKIFMNSLGGKLSVEVPFTITHGYVRPGVMIAEPKAPPPEWVNVYFCDRDEEALRRNPAICRETGEIQTENIVASTTSTKPDNTNTTTPDENEITKHEEQGPI